MIPTELRITIDGRPLVGNRTGIGVMTAEIVGRLESIPRPLIASHRSIEVRDEIEQCRFAVHDAPFGVVWQQVHLSRYLDRENTDVFWAPHGTLPFRCSVPSVATIHDLTSITMPHRHRWKTILSFNMMISRSLASATRITSISTTVADEVMRGFGIPANRIEVVPLGVSPFFSPSDTEPGTLPFGLEPRSYLLFVGTIEPRKGIDDLLEAWKMAKTGLRLVVSGGEGWGSKRLRRNLLSAGALLTGYVDRDQQRELYRHASAFVLPSHYEGFGLPVLEAMACGTPVIASRGGALPEVVGDAGFLVDPGRPDELCQAIRILLGDADLQADLRQKGLDRARSATWERTAELMMDQLVRATEVSG